MARKPRKASSASENGPKVRVRMYRQGLGDCFLITFDVGGNERHMLIDCGTLGATTTGVSLKSVVADIMSTTKRGTSSHLDLVVATHEHWDHVKAFHTESGALKGVTVDNVWLAWTENPKDDLAKGIKKYARDLGRAVAAAARAAPERSAVGASSRGMLEFYGGLGALGASDFSESVNSGMEFVRSGMGATTTYHKPGEAPMEPAFIPGFRFYVLGPPYDETKLANMGEAGTSGLYGVAAGLRGAVRRAPGAAPATPAEAPLDEAEMPFDARMRAPVTRGPERWYPSYFLPSERWRNVDDDWLGVVSDLALQLDDMTNNTSFALAIERIADGRVLLFPADAQLGNWLSWHDPGMRWRVKDAAGNAKDVTASNLLERTVFYKVGHHASHNATARERGLELMTRQDELTAFIPVDRAVALSRHPKNSWKMPARPLYKRLLERCQGRVVRSDLGWADDAANAKSRETEAELRDLASQAQWTAWKASQQSASHVKVGPHFIDYLLA